MNNPSPLRGTLVPLVAFALAVGLVGAAAAGCGDDESGSPAATGARHAPDKVVLVTYDAYALPEGAAKAFEAETGARVQVVASGDAGAMLSKALLSAGSPEGDVLFGVDNTLASRVTDESLLEDFTAPAAADLPADVKVPGASGDQLTPIDRGDVCVNIDTSWFAARGIEPPATLDDLVDPRYKDLLVVQSPVSSSPGLAFLAGTVESKGEGWLDYWRKLKDNGVEVAPSWDQAYEQDYTVSGGDRPLVVSYASSPPAEVADGTRSEPASGVMTGACVEQVEYAGVLRGAEHPELARKLVEFMLSPQWQQSLPESNYVYPVTDVALPEAWARWAPVPTDPIRLDAAEVGADRDKWIEQWRGVME